MIPEAVLRDGEMERTSDSLLFYLSKFGEPMAHCG